MNNHIGTALWALAGIDTTKTATVAFKTIVEKRCKCGALAGDPQPCPYQSDIEGIIDLCDCCDTCRNECERDI
jgi:hypothetical protein